MCGIFIIYSIQKIESYLRVFLLKKIIKGSTQKNNND